jgi:hypothetical protein
MTRLSCHRFQPGKVRLWLSVIAFGEGQVLTKDKSPQDDDGFLGKLVAGISAADALKSVFVVAL